MEHYHEVFARSCERFVRESRADRMEGQWNIITKCLLDPASDFWGKVERKLWKCHGKLSQSVC
jgi:hypothetical protein